MRRLFLAFLAPLGACGESDPAASVPESESTWPVTWELGSGEARFQRVVLVTFDTLRADHVSSYGYFRRTTPFLDLLASRGVLFERAMAAVSHTGPSHATMLTGLTPLEHGVEQNGHSLPEDANDLGRLLGEAGFETAAFVNVEFLRGVATSFGKVETDTNAGPLVDAALRWLRRERGSDRFFLWLHLYGPHRWKEEVYAPTRTLAELEADDGLAGERLYEALSRLHGLPQRNPDGTLDLGWTAAVAGSDRVEANTVDEYLTLVGRYDAHTRHADKLAGELYAVIERELDLAGTSLWILTSDHGEGLASHGVAGHGSRIYQEQLHVPLVLHASDGSLGPARVAALVQHVDLFPTVADYLGARVRGLDPALHGASLRPLLEGTPGWSDRPAFSQRRPLEGDAKGKNAEELYALQSDRHKVLVHGSGEDEFYDLEEDPLELRNLFGAESREYDALRTLLRERVEIYRARRLSGGDVEIPADWLLELQALGYAE